MCSKSRVKFNIDSDCCMTFESENGVMAVSKASGFRKMTFSLALNIALWKMNSITINALFLDETLSSCDKSNTITMIEIMESIMSSKIFDVLFIISHDETVKANIEHSLDIISYIDKYGNVCKCINNCEEKKYDNVVYDSVSIDIDDGKKNEKESGKKNVVSDKIICDICDITISRKSYNKHLLTSKHKQNISKLKI